MELKNSADDPTFINLQTARSDLKTLLTASANISTSYEKMDEKFESIQESLNMASKRVAPLQSLSIANKALDTRINRAISPALDLLESFKLSESLQRKLLYIASELLLEKKPRSRLKKLIKYLDCVDKLNESINVIGQESEPAVQKLQEVVEFLSRTKATNHYRTERLRETLVTLKAVCETEVDEMRFDGLLDEALLNLQDEFEGLLQKLKHRITNGDGDDGGDGDGKVEGDYGGLGSNLEVDVLRRISETLAANDCLDICIDMFVKIRYRRAAKALMRLNPDYLRTYTPEEIDEMEWEALETSISLWIQHFELAVKTVLVSEKNLCERVLGNIMGGTVWRECFIKISDKIMAVFFRFGEGVTRSNKEPQKLFKLLDMFDSLEKLKPGFSEVFSGESGSYIRSRFRELEKLIVHSSTRVFWEFGLQIEGNHDGLPPPEDGSVPKLVRYAVNYLKNLSVESYSAPMEKVLETEKLWKTGNILTKAEENDRGYLLRDAVSNVMEAIGRNVESKKLRYRDKVLAQVFAMNTYWYIYMRSRNTELRRLLGEAYMKKRYRFAAEESAYMYRKLAWGGLARLLEREEIGRESIDEVAEVREKIEAFTAGFNEMCRRHANGYRIGCDADLREQMKVATVGLIVPLYSEFYDMYASALADTKEYHSPERIEALLGQIFEGGGEDRGRRDRRVSVDQSRFSKDYRRSESDL